MANQEGNRHFRIVTYHRDGRVRDLLDGELTPAGHLPSWALQTLENSVTYRVPTAFLTTKYLTGEKRR